MQRFAMSFFAFFFNDTATTEIYTLSLHDALPISVFPAFEASLPVAGRTGTLAKRLRSEEHTSELQSRQYLVCRLLLEKKKNKGIEMSLYPISIEKKIHSRLSLIDDARQQWT